MKPWDAVTPEVFYRGKHTVHEEWFVNDGDLMAWARLRVFDDGTADVWEFGQLWGFVNEACARFMIREGHYVDLLRLVSLGEKPLCEPPKEQANAANQPFHWGGDWYTGLDEPGASADQPRD
jgi:hypothetical protein